MDTLTMEQYRDYLVKRIEGLTKFIEHYENAECLSQHDVDVYLRAYAALDDVMERLFVIDNAVYAAQTATAARAFCPPLPVTAHGHCPANYDILGMARQ